MPWPGRFGVDDRFDDRHGDADRRARLHRLEHLFVEAGLARRHLQLGLAGDAIDGAREREQHALIRGVHADEHRDAEHDAGRRQQRPQDVLAEVRPADQAQQDHRRCRLTSSTMRPSRSAIVRWQLSRDVHVVRDDDDGRAEARVQVADQRQDLVAGVRVEVAGRLVGEQDRRIDRQRARDGDALALAARELVGQVLQPMLELHERRAARARARRLSRAASRAGAAAGRRSRGTRASAAG